MINPLSQQREHYGDIAVYLSSTFRTTEAYPFLYYLCIHTHTHTHTRTHIYSTYLFNVLEWAPLIIIYTSVCKMILNTNMYIQRRTRLKQWTLAQTSTRGV